MNASLKRLMRLWLPTGIVLMAGGLFYALARLGYPIPCLFYKLTGLHCPGCGNTRAALALLRLDFPAAFSYNFFFLPEFIYLGYVYCVCAAAYLKTGKFTYRPPLPLLVCIFLGCLLLWWIIRNILHI